MTQASEDDYVALQGVRVLLVDSDPDSCELLTVCFELYGAEVASVRSVPAAIDCLMQFQPQLLLLLSEIRLPGQDGYRLMQAIRTLSLELGKPLRAIALTASADAKTRQRSLEVGFDCHVAKPVDPHSAIASGGQATQRCDEALLSL